MATRPPDVLEFLDFLTITILIIFGPGYRFMRIIYVSLYGHLLAVLGVNFSQTNEVCENNYNVIIVVVIVATHA